MRTERPRESGGGGLASTAARMIVLSLAVGTRELLWRNSRCAVSITAFTLRPLLAVANSTGAHGIVRKVSRRYCTHSSRSTSPA